MSEIESFRALGLALGLGLLVGLQRERAKPDLAGIRTFTIITLLGAATGLLSSEQSQWPILIGMLAVAVMLVVGNLFIIKTKRGSAGITTEMAALMMYVVGSLLALNQIAIGIVLAGGTAVLLQWKQPLHSFVKQIGEQEIRAITKFVLLALIILPLLPDKTYGPYEVLNPYKIWLMVVLIVGISAGAFVAHLFLKPRSGSVLGGILGGLISSTATTVSFARQTKTNIATASHASLVIVIASTVVYLRILFEIAVVAPGLLPHVALPLIVMLIFMSGLSALQFVKAARSEEFDVSSSNPVQLKPALIFGALYAIVLLVAAAARDYIGASALYAVAGFSGLTDVDAITLSAAELYTQGRIGADIAWRVVLLASLSNLVFKAAIVGLLGSRQVFVEIASLFGSSVVAGAAILWLLPAIR